MNLRSILLYFSIALACGVLVFASFSFGFFSGPERFFEDLLFTPRPFDSDIVIVSIDNESLTHIGQWPWPREVFAQAFSHLAVYHPRVVGVDVLFAEPSRFGEADDRALAGALGKVSYPVVFPTQAPAVDITKNEARAQGALIAPRSLFTTALAVTLGHANMVLDRDGVVRSAPLALALNDGKGSISEAFALKVAQQSGKTIPNRESLQDISRIVYAGVPGSVRRIPFWRLVNDDGSLHLDRAVVLMGVTSPDLHDDEQTPVSKGAKMSGVEIQANIVNMLLQGYRLTSLPPWVSMLWIMAAALLVAFFFVLFPRSVKPLIAAVGTGLLYNVAVVVLFGRGMVASMLHINGAWMLGTVSLFSYRYGTGERERRHMKSAFSRYVATDVLEDILKDPKNISLGGEERTVTLLFSDIRGFTTLSEKTTPHELVRLLNVYFTAMTGEVLKTNGVVDKYIGDAIMAFWGAPLPDEHQADHALSAALGMSARLKELNERFRGEGSPEIAIGIGIYTGPAIVGNIGSDQRFDYTAIGDTVNVASRLEGLNKEHGTTLIVGESTKQKVTLDVAFREIGSVKVKGRNEPVMIYTVEG